MDFATLIGLALCTGAVFGGFIFEGGHLEAVMQPTAAIIIGGGTLGTLFVQFPMSHIMAALKGLKNTVMPPNHNLGKLIADIVGYAQKARREGVVSLEGDAAAAKSPFLKKALSLAVDGTESRLIREAMEVDLTMLAEEGEQAAKVMEAGGGYAPTIGILGAVLGLIHVMENINEPAKLGAGIAVAFVATVYGVFLANVIFLPLGSKLKLRATEANQMYELMLMGVLGIVDGENPRIIEQKLTGFMGEHGHHKKEGAKP